MVMGSGWLDPKLQQHEKRCGVGRAGSGRGRIRKEHRDAAWLSKVRVIMGSAHALNQPRRRKKREEENFKKPRRGRRWEELR